MYYHFSERYLTIVSGVVMNFCYSKGIVKPFYQWDAFNYCIKYAELLTSLSLSQPKIRV